MVWRIDYGNRPWHQWFAWYPVRIAGTDYRAWLQWVERETENCMGWRIHRYRLLEGRANGR